jgi:ankyrin repeat protein
MTSTEELFAAIEAEDAERVRRIVAAEPDVAAARDEGGVSALLRAHYRSDRASVEAIRAALPSLDVFEAAAFGDVDRLTELLDGDPTLAGSRSGDGFTPLHLAAFFGRTDAVDALVRRGADVDAVGTGWMVGTALHSATSARHAEIVGRLLDAGADPDARQAEGWTPLHSAAHNGDADSVERLLAHGARADLEDDRGRTAETHAREAGHDALAERLAQAVA